MGSEVLLLDVIALLIQSIVLLSVYYKHMTEGQENKAFLNVQFVALVLTLLDMAGEYLINHLNNDPGRVVAVTIFIYGYMVTRYLFPVIYLLFILSEAGILYVMEKSLNRLVVFGTYGLILMVLFSNSFTHQIFTVTLEEGYTRGSRMPLLFSMGLLYYLMGYIVLICCRKLIHPVKWWCLMSAYIVGIAAAAWQATHARTTVEVLAYAIMILMGHLFIQRPEQVVDFSVNIYSWWQYREHLRRCEMAKHPLKLIVLRYINASEVRALLGEMEYNHYMRHTSRNLRELMGNQYGLVSMYYGPVGCIAIVFDDVNANAEDLVQKIEEYHELRAAEDVMPASVLQLRIAVVRFLIDITHVEAMINFSVNFPRLMKAGQTLIEPEQIANKPEITIRNQSAEIIARALEQNEFEMYYQPIYNVEHKKFTSAEALIRLNDSKYGFVPPSIFVPEAERLGYMKSIGHFVLDSVYAFLSEVQEEALGLTYMEINLSVQQCVQNNLMQEFAMLEQRYDVSPSQVNLEVTETMSSLNPKTMTRNLENLYERGYRFSLDDYGTGYSNIVRIIHLPIDIVKIDKSLIDKLDEERCRNIVADTVGMMHHNGLKVVCEGVETEEQAYFLESVGCDYIQGFYYAKPMPREAFVAFLREHNM
jgi:EAL domain-containing protein (putative c-di-GMP-specific phosphodiesterase class I)